jgi:uncharacterized protein
VKMAAPLGVLAGMFGSVVGVGGGVLIVPAIASAVNIPQRVVTGTSLIAVLSTAAVSTYNFSASGCVSVEAAAIVGGAAMLSAPVGAKLTSRMDCNALRKLLACFLLGAAPLVPLKAWIMAGRDAAAVGGEGEEDQGDDVATSDSSSTSTRAPHWTDGDGDANESKSKSKSNAAAAAAAAAASFDARAAAPQLAAIGLAAGLASGLLGIGGGTIVTPALALASPLPQAAVLGTSLLAMLPPSAAALVAHRRLGNVDARMGAALAVGTALGSALGSSVAVDAPRGALELMFMGGMLFLSYRTFRTVRR